MSHSAFWGRSCTAFGNTQHHNTSHIRPVVLIETRSIRQLFLVNVQDGAFPTS
jgi:hypothetical protein